MRKYYGVVIDQRGRAVPEATATVTVTGTSTPLVTVYSDEGITSKDNPIVTDSNGRFNFFATNGYYRLFIQGLYITSYTMDNVFISDTGYASWTNYLGEFATDPDTGSMVIPSLWYNTTDLKLKMWNGVEIVLVG